MKEITYRLGEAINFIRSYHDAAYCARHGLVEKQAGHVNQQPGRLTAGQQVRTDYGGNFEAVYTIVRIAGGSVDLDRPLEARDGTVTNVSPYGFPAESIIPADIVVE